VPVLQHAITIAAPVERVFAVARDVERFPEFMPDVRRTTIVEASEDGRRQVVEWVGMIPAFKLTVKWTEEDLWDEVERTCRFSQVKGDFTEYWGLWRFVKDGNRTVFESELRYELEIPTIGPLIRGVVRKIMNDNVERLQHAIQKRCEGPAQV
jgi:ribosome-associated toxin RatA of RatAB toxin-antitoxin module